MATPRRSGRAHSSRFFELAPDAALGALIALVNFCTERWIAEIMRNREGMPPGVTLLLGDGSEKTFLGWWQVFGSPQSNSMHNGHFFSALDALERWLTLKLDAGDDISAIAERMLREGNWQRSSAFCSTWPSIDHRCWRECSRRC